MSTHAADSVGTPSIEKTIWRIDPDRSSVEFNTKALWGIVTVKGRFSRYQGTLRLSGEPAIELTIEADSIDTENEKRDRHLRSPDFFSVEQRNSKHSGGTASAWRTGCSAASRTPRTWPRRRSCA
ncbi:MAG TPA: YceI family protein [Solirubrobacteraceae bacterium]|nr:YceI family protein [Solirubrobacteraceae bacterium]